MKLRSYFELKRLLRHYRRELRREKRLVARYGGFGAVNMVEFYEWAINEIELRIADLKKGKVPV